MAPARKRFVGIIYAGMGFLLMTSAWAEEPRYVPEAGASLTYKMMNITTLPPNPPFTTGLTFVYQVKSSDGLTSEGSIALKSTYVSHICPEHNCDKFDREMEQVHGRKEGELFAADIPSGVTDELNRLSAFRFRYFVRELEHFPLPNIVQGGFDQAPLFVMSTSLDCDKALLASFFPLGKTPRVVVPCTESVERLNVHPPMKETPPQKHDVTLELSYEGKSRVTTAAGEWAVQNIRAISTRHGTLASSETELQFSEQIGAVVKSHTVSRFDSTGRGIQNDRELVAFSR